MLRLFSSYCDLVAFQKENHRMIKDFHTHNLAAAPGTAIVNLPLEALRQPETFELVPGGLYSVGIHPWWTTFSMDKLWTGLEWWARHPQVVAIGECGLDRLKGASLTEQQKIFLRQIQLSEHLHLPLTIHCVKAFDVLLALRKKMSPSERWTVHGFRGKPALAQQLLQAGFHLSYGLHYNAESFALTPPERRHRETDDAYENALANLIFED